MTAKEELTQMIERAILDGIEEYKQAAEIACMHAVDKAIELEREACAQIAESDREPHWRDAIPNSAARIAARIRARSKSE